MFDTKVVEKIKTHVLCSVTFSENRAVYEIMSKNMVEPDGSQTIRCKCFSCWISEAIRAKAHACERAPIPVPTPTHPLTHTPTHTHTHAHTHAQRNMQYLSLFHGDNGFVNAPHCYVILTMPVLLQLSRVRLHDGANMSSSGELHLSRNYITISYYFNVAYRNKAVSLSEKIKFWSKIIR
jgi:hypothetical protein